MQSEKTQEHYKALCIHIGALNQEMVSKQNYLLEHPNLPIDTVITIHKKLVDLASAMSWMMHVASTQYKAFMPKNGEPSSLITN